ncbi:DUF11 domain-containing protein [Chryseobacterium gallinarum]|uniref:DUF11 domain-containing protein n=1 Tax=Chryseobacterium gallinarum TaxID=1324352 RepID=UPI00202573FB|nr:DUF11 domain-containing protein [Chryseobacterium gallinarum]MCL8538629.1 DUF11 domain-containing protein [Chryseobacterium gallinarum]
MNRIKGYVSSYLILFSVLRALAQNTPSLEFATAQGTPNPTGNGPVTNTVITFVKNTNNPSGNTFQTHSPSLTATFQIINFGFDNAALIGYNNNNTSAPIFPLQNAAGAPPNSSFTSSGASTGIGIDTASNKGVGLFFNTDVLNGGTTFAEYEMADLVITFSRPVNDPILHIGGMGGVQGQLGFTGFFEYKSSNVPVTFVRLSGNSNNFTVNSTFIRNTAQYPTSTGVNSASGSVLVRGKGITSLTMRMWVRGDGGASSWTTQSGDVVTMGISLLESNLAVTKTVNNPNPDRQSTVIFTITATNNGPSDNTNVRVTDVLPDGYTFISAASTVGSYENSTGIWTIGNLGNNATATLNITALVNCDGNYTNTATISGDNSDPGAGDNSASVTPNVSLIPCACYNNANNSAPGTDSQFGITLLKRAGIQGDHWPMIRKSAHLVLESNTKGLVINRMTTAELSNITSPVEGMILYDTTEKCLKIYSDNTWSCFSTPACP